MPTPTILSRRFYTAALTVLTTAIEDDTEQTLALACAVVSSLENEYKNVAIPVRYGPCLR
eukprot:IDg7977t1